MNWVAVDWITIDFFVVVKDAMAPERACTNNVSICQDISAEAKSV